MLCFLKSKIMDRICTICCDTKSNLTSIFETNKTFDGVSLLEMIKIDKRLINEIDNCAALLICHTCTQNIITSHNFLQKCTESVVKKAKPCASFFVDAGTQTESPKCTLIINNITRKDTYKEIDKTEFEGLFTKYGEIRAICTVNGRTDKCGRITYATESSAVRAFRAAQQGKIKYNGHNLAVTLVSDDYTPADILSNHCLQKIFSYLCIDDRLSAELVCKRWYENCLPGWHTVKDYYMLESDETENKIRILNRCGRYLQNLHFDVTEDDHTEVFVFAHMRKHCINLEKLLISWDNQPTDSQCLEIAQVFKQCKRLRRFRLRYADKNFDLECLKNLPKEMIEIHIDCGRWENANRLAASIDLSKFKNLQALSLMALDFKMDDLKGIEEVSNLRYLRLELSNYDLRNVEAVQRFKKLEFLGLTNCSINDEFLINVIRKNKKLKYLDISDDFNLTERSLRYLKRAQLLETLIVRNLSNITDTHLSTLHQLKELNCSGCRSVKDWGLMALIDSSTNLRSLSALNCSVTTRLIASAKESMEPHHAFRSLCLNLNEESVTIYEPLVDYQALFLFSRDNFDDNYAWDSWCVE